MINALIFLAGCLSTLPFYFILLKKIKKKFENQLEAMEQMCYEEFEALISKMNHEGPIPNGASASGLLNLILLAMNQIISSLEKSAKEMELNLQKPISALRLIVMVELTLLKEKLDEFIKSKRDILKDYHIKK